MTVRDRRRLGTAGNLSGLRESLGEFAAQRRDRRQRLGSEAPWLVLGPERRRFSTWGVPRFLQSFDETLDGGLTLPRGLRDTVTSLADQAGSRLEITDDRVQGTAREFTFNAILTGEQREAVRARDSCTTGRIPGS